MNSPTNTKRLIASLLALSIASCFAQHASAQNKKDQPPAAPSEISPTAPPVLTEATPAAPVAPAVKVAPPAKPAVQAPGPLELPAAAAPSKELLPLAFMAGRWIGVNPNKSVNEEHWSAPRGNNMTALFRQIRRDGKPGLLEVSLITAEPEGVMLRLRHLHGMLEIPEGREEVSLFKLKSAANNRAEFTGTGKAEQVTSVVYRLVGTDQLAMDITFAPTSKEKGYTSLYNREGVITYTPAPAKPAATETVPQPADATKPAAEKPAPAKPTGK